MKHSFEVSIDELKAGINAYVDQTTAELESSFITMPAGEGFIPYSVFEMGYETLKRATEGFCHLQPNAVLAVVESEPVVMIVLRTMLGFTPPEWAYVASQAGSTKVSQGAARSLDRAVRLNPTSPLRSRGVATRARIAALVNSACSLLQQGAPPETPGMLHRLDKADTKSGIVTIRAASSIGVPYAMLLYERLLGRPFAGHRDSVSEIVGDTLEGPIETILTKGGVSFRKTMRAERVVGFDQAPDFIIPSEFNPQVVIEAKVTEDDGTARDKVTRVQHLASLSLQRGSGKPSFQVVACIAGRGFRVRRADMQKLLLATSGKVFTPRTLARLISCTRLSEFSAISARQ